MPAPSLGNWRAIAGAFSRYEAGAQIFAAAGLLAIGEIGGHREMQRRRRRRAGEAQDQRPRQDREGQRRGDRVAGETDQRDAAHLAPTPPAAPA